MNLHNLNPRPSVPSTSKGLDHGSSRVTKGREGAKNHWVGPGCHRTTIWLGTYNVRGLTDDSKLEQLENELSHIKCDIIGLSEIGRRGEEYIILRSGNHFMYKSDRYSGVAFIVNKRITPYIESFNAISDRIAYINLRVNTRTTLKITQVYAPTSTYPDEDIEMFYDQLKIAIEDQKATYNVIMGDFNAKLGTKQEENETQMGNYGFGDRNERGERMLNFMSELNLYSMNSFFKKGNNRKWTWLSPNRLIKNEIDYIMTNHKPIIQDVTVLNNFDVGSDHRMVRAKVVINKRLERQTIHKRKEIRLTNSELEMVSNEFKEAIETKLLSTHINDHNSTDIDELNETLTDVIRESIKEVTKRTKNKTTPTDSNIDKNVNELIKKRRELNQNNKKGTIEYVELNKLIKRKIKENKRKKAEALINEVIENNKNMKCLRPNLGQKQIHCLIDQQGNITTDKKKLLEIVEQFYGELYDTRTKQKRESINKNRILNIGSEELPQITIEEVENALTEMKKNKAPGEDKITIDMILKGGHKLISIITRLLDECLQKGTIPNSWNNAEVVLLYKKGDRRKLENYRPITLLSHLYKLLTKIITTRLTKKMDEYQPNEQAGFRKGFSTADHLLTMKLLIEKSNEYNMQIYIGFVDYEKAFDSIETWAIQKALRNCRIDSRYNQLLQTIFDKATATYQLHDKTKPIQLKRGIRQGDSLSPKLFTLALEDVFKELNWTTKGIDINGKNLNHLRYADDVVIIATSAQDLQEMLEELNTESKKVGLKMNLKKTKVMFNGEHRIFVDHNEIEKVTEYIYLGQKMVIGTGNQTAEIVRRTRQAWVAFGRLSFILKNKNIPTQLKTKVFNTCILPVLCYGAETWTMTQKNINSLRVTQRAMERAMLGISLRDRKTNVWIRRKTRVIDVVEFAAKQKWTFAGHVARTGADRWSRAVLVWRPYSYRRSRGRPPMRWTDDLKLTAGFNWIQQANNRDKWRADLEEAYIRRWMQSAN